MTVDFETRKNISTIANQLMNGGLLQDAQKFLEDSIIADPADGRLFYQLGTCFDRMSKQTWGVKRSALREQSAQAYMVSSNAYQHDFFAANMAATQLLKTGRPALALGYALRAHNLRPSDIACNVNVAKSYEGMGNICAALAYYQHVSDAQNKNGSYSRARISALTA